MLNKNRGGVNLVFILIVLISLISLNYVLANNYTTDNITVVENNSVNSTLDITLNNQTIENNYSELIPVEIINNSKETNQTFKANVLETKEILLYPQIDCNRPNIIECGEHYTVYKNTDGETVTASIHISPVNYYNGSEYLPIDTRIMSSNSLWDYEVTRGIYQAYFKEDPSTAETVKFQKGNSYLIFQPMFLNYRSDLDQIQQINIIQSVNGIPNENEFFYNNAFGNNLSLIYKYQRVQLKENLIINNFNDLPEPQDYIKAHSPITLDLEFLIDYSSNTEVYISGELWDKKSTKKTSERVDFKVDGKTIFFLPKPYAYDSNKQKQLLVYMFKKQGSKLYLIIKTPYSFLQNALYPVTIDPTSSINIAPSADATLEQENPNTNVGTDIEIQVHSRDSNRNHRIFLKFDLSSISSGTDITNSTLFLHCNYAVNLQSSLDQTYIYEVDDDTWTENGITWNNQPSISTLINTGPSFEPCDSGAQQNNQWGAWNITAFTQEQNNGNDIMSLGGKAEQEDDSEGKVMNFDSKEAGGSYDPYVNVTYFTNAAPVLSGIPDNSTNEDIAPPGNWIDLYPYASDDVDTDAELMFSIQSESNSALIDCSIGSDRYLNCAKPAANQTGYSNVIIKVTDTGGLTDTDTIKITVNPVNDPPSISGIPDMSTRKNGDARNINISLWSYAYDVDNNDSFLNYSTILQTDATLINCTVTFDKFLTCSPPMDNQTGYNDVTIETTDGEYTDNDTTRITVYTYNYPPSFENDTKINSTIISPTKKGNLIEFTANIQDADNDTVRLLICDEDGLSGLSCLGTKFCSDPTMGNESIGPKSCTYNTSSVTETNYLWTSYACDNNSQCTTGVNGYFYISNPRNLTLYLENITKIWNYYGYMDMPQDINDFTQELIDAQGDCAPDADGYCNISLDLRSETAGVFEIYNIQIYYNTSENRAPRIDVYTPEDLTPFVYEASDLEFDHHSSDPDGNNLSYNWTLNGIQQSINTSWIYSPSYGDAGSYTLILVVSDGNLTDSQTWNVTVLLTDNAPTITLVTPGNNNVSETGNITFNCSATDDYKLINITLYHNIDGIWKANKTKSLSGTYDSEIFTINNIPVGNYLWNCKAMDNITQSAFASVNYSFSITTAPDITLFLPENNSYATTNLNISFIYVVSDPGQIVNNCSLILNDIINKTDNSITKNTNQTFSQILQNGVYNWKIGCYNDQSYQGNSSIRSLNVSYNTYPWVVDLMQNATVLYQGDEFAIRCLVEDQETANNSLSVQIEYQHGGDSGWHYCSSNFNETYQWWECIQDVGYGNYSGGYWDFRCNVSDGGQTSNWTIDTDAVQVLTNFGVDLQMPVNNSYQQINNVNFTYNITTEFLTINNCSLYLYKNNMWQLNKTDSNIENGLRQTFNVSLETNAYNWKVSCYDSYNTQINSTIYQLIILGNKLYSIQNSTDTSARFYDNGELVLAGTCTISNCNSPPANSFVIQNTTSVNAYVDPNGNLCIETGDCSDQSVSCNNPPSDAFIIQNNAGSAVSYIDSTGDLCLTGILIENGSP